MDSGVASGCRPRPRSWFSCSPTPRRLLLLLGVLRLGLDFASTNVELGQQPAGGPGIGVLVEARSASSAKSCRSPLGQRATDRRRAAPRAAAALRSGSRGSAAHRLGHRAFGALGDPLEAFGRDTARRARSRLAATPAMRREPSASTRACSTASNTPAERLPPARAGVHRVVVIAQPQRDAVGGAAQLAPSRPAGRARVGSGTRARLPPGRPGPARSRRSRRRARRSPARSPRWRA